MRTLLSVAIATLIFGGHILYLFLRRRRKELLYPVEAGPTADPTEDFTQKVSVRVGEMRKTKGFSYYVVRNDCMKPIGIESGDIVGVQPFDENFKLKDVEEGDVLLIYLDDEKFHGHKIRVMDHVEGNAFVTYYYVGNKKRQLSSNPHSFNTICGVVREVNHPYRDAS